jgi:phosphoribosyl-ATP pyrophosphohydrolase
MDGETVQLVQGARKVLDAGDPMPIARAFGVVGEIAVVDLDAALEKGSNAGLIEPLLGVADCRVGGGIRDARAAVRWLDAGATRVVLGTSAVPEVLRELPRERVIAALDARDGDVVTHGWTTRTGASVADRMRELGGYAGEFLVTFVEGEGTLQGTNMERALELGEIAKEIGCRLTVAGGVKTVEEIATLDRAGIDAQIGMALYTGRFTTADAIVAMLSSDRADGLYPTVVADERGMALGLAYSSAESLRVAIAERRGVYHSRSRGGIWRKGETSGATQELLRVDLDCDRDAIRFTVRQGGAGFCHNGTRTCFGKGFGKGVNDARGLGALEARLAGIAEQVAREGGGSGSGGAGGSYTARLLGDAALLGAKVREEAAELVEASERGHVVREAADVMYFTMVRLAKEGIDLVEVERELDRRARRVTRRPGDAKPAERARVAPDSGSAGGVA